LSLQDGSDPRSVPGHDPATGHFVRGFRGAYKTRQQTVAARLEALTSQYKADNPADLALLALAAVHVVDSEKARNRVNRTRAANAAMRILKQIPRKPEPTPTIEELLGYDDEAANG
jgi:hypothetical protein